ncbi:hypothetical protein HLB23_28335 [Nocardia uniformis]|uniref:Uncharacterized protein n=1 Tax=Nocardia uniformis TaxID=53432 RepID=A0A849C7H3_9NOCA|nr:hypothetical protein [Nocardia uniformis]NNH73716.1 hypothetical protein [Nocardia uniformis]
MGLTELVQWESRSRAWRVEHGRARDGRDLQAPPDSRREFTPPGDIETREVQWMVPESRVPHTRDIPAGRHLIDGPQRYSLLAWLGTVADWRMNPDELSLYGELPRRADIADAAEWLHDEGFATVWRGDLAGKNMALLVHPAGMLAEVVPQGRGSTELWAIHIWWMAEPVDTFACYMAGVGPLRPCADTTSGWISGGRTDFQPGGSTGALRVQLAALRSFATLVTPWPHDYRHIHLSWLGGEPHGPRSQREMIERTDELLKLPEIRALFGDIYDKMRRLDSPLHHYISTAHDGYVSEVADKLVRWASTDDETGFDFKACRLLDGLIHRQASVQRLPDAEHANDLNTVDMVAIHSRLRGLDSNAANIVDNMDLWDRVYGDGTILVDYPQLLPDWAQAITSAATILHAHLAAADAIDASTLSIGERWSRTAADPYDPR